MGNQGLYNHYLCTRVPPTNAWLAPTISSVSLYFFLDRRLGKPNGRHLLSFAHTNPSSIAFSLQHPFSTGAFLEDLPPNIRDDFLHSLGLAQQAARAGIVPSSAASNNRSFERWSTFCHRLRISEWLDDIKDPIAILQVYAQKYREGTLAPSKRTT
jgi:hypothetical protein